jgi:3'-phosphoadenosine 5'-phosphosulfate sulfotransferase (PAPS reductase)/FAD synthetase
LEKWQLRQRQALSLDAKILLSQQKTQEWYEHWEGQVYVAFSGGKDSTVLLHLVRSIYPDVPAVFADTGLEYPEIKEHVRATENVVWVRPKKSFKQVIEEYGYPIISKQVARFVRDLQNPTEHNAASRNLRLTGMNQKGCYCSSQRLPKKWLYLVDAPFKVSEQCCTVMKKEPVHRYDKESGRKPFIGMMAADSEKREKAYLSTGCNAFSLKRPQSQPMAFWTEQDVLLYLKTFGVPYAKVYGDIVDSGGGQLITTGERHTGCCYCAFGVHLEKGENRFQRMARTHPQLYNYCINQLGLGQVLDYIHVDYCPLGGLQLEAS